MPNKEAFQKRISTFSDILSVLPHRYPFLLIDAILKIISGESIVVLKNISASDPVFQGHFPEKPIYPGVLILEAMAQAGAFIIHDILGSRAREFIIMGYDKARFRHPVVPGDQLIITVTKKKMRKDIFKGEAIATVDGQLVAETELIGGVPIQK
ncbi:MAG: 3-hydroxyacyl-ACP dehydratase FabZ [Patescibacteria group bacterium]|nr:3-hydroxyacyl-ACP dehydratase FabZ [Patescibacteria group bacterium]